MSKTIPVEVWLDLFETLANEVLNKLTDDGKLSVMDIISLVLLILRLISKAVK